MFNWRLLNYSFVWLFVYNNNSINSKSTYSSIFSWKRNFTWEEADKFTKISSGSLLNSNIVLVISFKLLYIKIIFSFFLVSFVQQMIMMMSSKNLNQNFKKKNFLIILIKKKQIFCLHLHFIYFRFKLLFHFFLFLFFKFISFQINY